MLGTCSVAIDFHRRAAGAISPLLELCLATEAKERLSLMAIVETAVVMFNGSTLL